jgi:hypothetical protein
MNLNARIGKQVAHHKSVDINTIKADFSDCKTYRYTLTFDFGLADLVNRTKKLSIILKNPSSADEKKADQTINRVQQYVYEHFKDVKTVTILNLFAFRGTDASDVEKSRLQSNLEHIVGEFNDKNILENVLSSEYLIFAWGGRSAINKKAYDERIGNLLNLIKQNNLTGKEIYRVNDQKGSNKYPFHACYWSNSFKKVQISLN